jgi:hypothetical protein
LFALGTMVIAQGLGATGADGGTPLFSGPLHLLRTISAPYDRVMTEPNRSGPYTGPPAPPPPQQGAPYPYATTPPAGYGRPPAPPGDPATVAARVAGALLIPGALLAIGGSFATLDKSVQYLGDGKEGEPVYESVAKAWSYSSSGATEGATSITQFSGVPLLLGGLLAIAAAVLLLAGRSRRFPLGPALGIVSAALLLGTTLTVLTDAVNDTQWDGDGRTTTFGAGFYLLAVSLLLALGATVTSVLALRGPAGTFPGSAPPAFQVPQPPQPWQVAPGAPVAQPHPPASPPAPHRPPAPPPTAD